MPSFGMITEGSTDLAVIENVIIGYFGMEPDITQLQPKDLRSFGNWENVLKYLETEEFKSALEYNEYIIIHMDTDIAEHPTLGIKLTEGGVARPIEELIQDLVSSFRQRIGEEFFNANLDRLIFAISVHCIECWILPCYCEREIDRKRVLNCEDHLQRALGRKEVAYEKTYAGYKYLSKPLTKKAGLELSSSFNSSLSSFLVNLEKVDKTKLD